MKTRLKDRGESAETCTWTSNGSGTDDSLLPAARKLWITRMNASTCEAGAWRIAASSALVTWAASSGRSCAWIRTMPESSSRRAKKRSAGGAAGFTTCRNLPQSFTSCAAVE